MRTYQIHSGIGKSMSQQCHVNVIATFGQDHSHFTEKWQRDSNIMAIAK